MGMWSRFLILFRELDVTTLRPTTSAEAWAAPVVASTGPEWRRRRPAWLVAALTITSLPMTLFLPFYMLAWLVQWWGGKPGQIITFLPYPLVWLAATWSEMKRELDDPDMHPWWHALSFLIPIYGLFRLHAHYRTIQELLLQRGAASPVSGRGAVLGMIGADLLLLAGTANLLLLAGTKVEGPVGTVDVLGGMGFVAVLVGGMGFVAVFVYGQVGLNRYWSARSTQTVPVLIHPSEWTMLLAGGVICISAPVLRLLLVSSLTSVAE
ncbi:MAG: hypothetical protein HW416_292 [Chloroflexi bacterium]|nr:hypothetical protein [Chloroflexota bacterium]